MNKEMLVGDRSDDKVIKGVDALTILTVLQTILVMMLFLSNPSTSNLCLLLDIPTYPSLVC